MPSTPGMERLREELLRRAHDLPGHEAIVDAVEQDTTPHPFHPLDLLVAFLIEQGALSVEEYRAMRDAYTERNPNLALYQITAPRRFGDTWAQAHAAELAPTLVKPTKELDPDYDGQYDRFETETGGRVELKATRVVEDGVNAPLPEKALASTTRRPYHLYFKQVKPDCCDVFLLLGVYLDRVRYWVVPATEMATADFYSDKLHRHGRGSGQIQLASSSLADVFGEYEATPDTLGDVIQAAIRCELGAG